MTEDEAMEMFIKAIMSHDGSPMAKDGDFYWGKLGDKWMVINSIVWSDGTVKYFLDGAEIKITDEELARPVLTPDDVAAKDAEIKRLQTGLQHYACECDGPCFLYGADIEKCGATAWEALNDRKKFSDMEVADTFRKLDAETISPLQEILIRQHEKITKLEAGLKKITDTDDLTITLDPLGSKRIAADTLTKAKER